LTAKQREWRALQLSFNSFPIQTLHLKIESRIILWARDRVFGKPFSLVVPLCVLMEILGRKFSSTNIESEGRVFPFH
jgi:hypothetical protein